MATVQVQNGAPIVIGQTPQAMVQQHQNRNINTCKNLAITQIVIGGLTMAFGIAVHATVNYHSAWHVNSGSSFWAGGWILFTGIIGVKATQQNVPTNLNGCYLGLSIIATCASALSGLFFILAVVYYAVQRNCGRMSCDVGLGFFIPLLLLMVTEFFVSIIAAVYACQRGCNGASPSGGIIIQPASSNVTVVTSTYPVSANGTFIPPSQYAQYQTNDNTAPLQPFYPPSSQYPPAQYPPPSQNPPQYSQQPPKYSAQPVYAPGQQYPTQTSVTYSAKPPPYAPQ